MLVIKNFLYMFIIINLVISLAFLPIFLESKSMKAEISEGRFHLTDTSELNTVVISFSSGMSISDTVLITGLAKENIIKVYEELVTLNDLSLIALKRALR